MSIALKRWLILLIVVGGLAIGGCSAPQAKSQASATATTETSVPATPNSSPQLSIPTLQGKATVVMTVNGSPITIEVDGTDAPMTAGNFVDLVQRGVYDGLVFHRVVRQPEPFVVQGGDPQGKDRSFPVDRLGTGSFIDPATSQPRYVPLEITPQGAQQPIYSKPFDRAGISVPPKLRHTRGAVAMARSSPPDSASSQFYFALADLPFLDGSYAVFGYVKSGMDVVDKIQQGDRIESAKVTQGAENLKK